MRSKELLAAATPLAGKLASDSTPGGLLSLIDAIEQRLALAREVVKAHARASAASSGAIPRPHDRSASALDTRPTREHVRDLGRKG
jgi:hypothetical protein